MSDSDSTKDGRAWAYLGAILGGAVSVAANVAHSYVPPATGRDDRALTLQQLADWAPHPGAVASSVFWPVFLFVGIEILARYDWPEGRRWLALRYLGLVPVMVVAAVVSYRHMSGLLAFYGEDPLTVAIGPLAVDGLMAMATGALIASGTRRKARRATRTATPAPVRVPVAPVAAATAARPATVTEPVAPKPKATRRPPAERAATRDNDNDLRTRARDMYLGGEIRLVKIAMKLDTNKRNVERWTKDLRATTDATDTAESADPEPAAAAAN